MGKKDLLKNISEQDLISIIEKAKKYDRIVMPFPDKLLRCSFCDKRQDQIELLISGVHSCICNECIAICNEVIKEMEAGTLPEE